MTNSLACFAAADTPRANRSGQLLLAADAGESEEALAADVSVGGSTVYRTKRRFVLGNLQTALRPRAERKLSGKEEAMLVATAYAKRQRDVRAGRWSSWPARSSSSRIMRSSRVKQWVDGWRRTTLNHGCGTCGASRLCCAMEDVIDLYAGGTRHGRYAHRSWLSASPKEVLAISREMGEAISAYRFESRSLTELDTIRRLIELGLDQRRQRNHRRAREVNIVVSKQPTTTRPEFILLVVIGVGILVLIALGLYLSGAGWSASRHGGSLFMLTGDPRRACRYRTVANLLPAFTEPLRTSWAALFPRAGLGVLPVRAQLAPPAHLAALMQRIGRLGLRHLEPPGR